MEPAVYPEFEEKKKPSLFKRILAVLLVTLLLFGAGAWGGLYILLKGPSAHAAGMAVGMVGQSPAADTVLGLFLTEEEITAYRQMGELQTSDSNCGHGGNFFSVYPQLG